VDHAFAVCVGERERDLLHEPRNPSRLERRLLLCDVEEIAAPQVLDDQVEEPLGILAPIEDGHDARMANATRGPRLEAKARNRLRMVRIAGIQDLDRDFALQRNLLGPVNPPDRAPPDHRSENVFAVEHPPRQLLVTHLHLPSNSPATLA
jgi:hypothetical protein